MKPISNFCNHAAYKYDESKTVIITHGEYHSPEMYLVTNKDVVEIIPLEVQYTNIGEPFRVLARFIFNIHKQEESSYIDIDPNDLQDLVNMFKKLGWASNIDISERFNIYLDSYEEE